MNDQNAPSNGTESNEAVKSAVKQVFSMMSRKAELEKELSEINSFLVGYGIDEAPASAPRQKGVRGPRAVRPEITIDSVSAFIKSNPHGVQTNQLVEHFGQKFNEWKKTNESKFRIEAQGPSKLWRLKK